MFVSLAIVSVAQSNLDEAESPEQRTEKLKSIYDIVAQQVYIYCYRLNNS